MFPNWYDDMDGYFPGIEVNLEDESIHVIASLLKDFLRNIPESILDCTIYQKWMSVIHNPDDSVKLECVRRYVCLHRET